MSQFTDNAFVIKYFNYKESDCIFTMLTENYGKISAIAKSVRKPKSKVSGHLQFLNLLDVSLHSSKSMHIIKEVKTLMYIPEEKQKELFYLINYICEVINKTIDDTQIQKEYFYFITRFVQFMITTNKTQLFYYNTFNIQLLEILGLGPVLNKCTKCNKKNASSKFLINTDYSGIICDSCSENSSNEITIEEIKLLNVCKKFNYELLTKITGINLDKEINIKNILDKAVDYHLNINIKSRGFV